jgi:hypothetical protein
VPLAIEQAGLLVKESVDCRCAAVLVHQSLRLWVRAYCFSDRCGQIAGLEGGYYQQELLEGHAEMTKSSLAKEKCIKVEDFVPDSHGQAWSRRCNRKIAWFRAMVFLTDDPETLWSD